MTRSRNSRRTGISCGPACESALRTAFCETSTAASAQRTAASRARRSRNGHRTTAASRRSGHQRRSWIRPPAWGDRDRDWRSCTAGSASRARLRLTQRGVCIHSAKRARPPRLIAGHGTGKRVAAKNAKKSEKIVRKSRGRRRFSVSSAYYKIFFAFFAATFLFRLFLSPDPPQQFARMAATHFEHVAALAHAHDVLTGVRTLDR